MEGEGVGRDTHTDSRGTEAPAEPTAPQSESVEARQNAGAEGDSSHQGVGDAAEGAGDKGIYSANGDPALRSTRRPAFDSMLNDGFEVNGDQYKLNEHAYNSLFKSGRKDIMPADINGALKAKPIPGNPGSVQYINPITGTTVFVNPESNEIVGIWPAGFGK